MVATVCSRSHGHSRRSRSVRRWSSRRASARPSISASSRGRNRDRRGRRRGWRITRLEADLALVVLLHLREPVRPANLLLLLGQVRLDLRLDLLEGLGMGRLDRPERLDDVPAVHAVNRLRDLVRLEREGGLVERRHRLLARAAGAAVRDTALPALRRGSRVLRVLLRQLGEARAVLQLRRDVARKALAVDEDVPHLARLRRRERGHVLVVVLLRRGRRHLDVRRHLRLELLAEQRRPEVVLLELVERDVVLLQRRLELLLAVLVVRLPDQGEAGVDAL